MNEKQNLPKSFLLLCYFHKLGSVMNWAAPPKTE